MSIRTTVTLDDDVLDRLKQEARAKGLPFRQILNDVLRTGLVARRTRSKGQPFVVGARDMGAKPGLNFDDIEGLIEFAEGELHR